MPGGYLRSVVLLVLFVALLTQCVVRADSGEIVVAITHPSLKTVVRAIGGDRVHVLALVPFGVDPHYYEPPAPELVALLRNARIVVMTGPSHLPIEMRIEELYRHGLFNWTLLTYRNYVSEGLELLINPATKEVNPHGYFLSLRGLKIIALSLYKTLVELDPEGFGYYERRLQDYLSYLERLARILESTKRYSGVIRVGLMTPLLQYASVDAGLEVKYLVVAEHGIPVEIRNILEAANNYGKLYDALVVSDEELAEYRLVIEELVRRGIRIAVIPLSILAQESPELVPVAIALSLSTPQPTIPHSNEQDAVVYLYYVTSMIPLVFIAVLAIYALKLRTYGAIKR